MKLSELMIVVLVCALVLPLSACTGKVQEAKLPLEPVSSETAQAEADQERSPLNMSVRIMNDGDESVAIPPQVMQLEFDRTKLFEMWPYEAYKQNSTFEVHVIASDPYTVVIWPFVLNGQDMPAKEGRIWVGVVSTDVTLITLNGEVYAPSIMCEGIDENGPNLYLIELDAKLLRQFQEELNAPAEDSSTHV